MNYEPYDKVRLKALADGVPAGSKGIISSGVRHTDGKLMVQFFAHGTHWIAPAELERGDGE